MPSGTLRPSAGRPAGLRLVLVALLSVVLMAAGGQQRAGDTDDAAGNQPAPAPAPAPRAGADDADDPDEAGRAAGWSGRAVVERVIDELGQRETLDTLVRHFGRYIQVFEGRIPERLGGSRITDVARRMFADPLGQVDEARRITDRLFAARDDDDHHDVPSIIVTLADSLGVALGGPDTTTRLLPAVPATGSGVDTWLDYLEAVLTLAAEFRERAFADLNAAERRLLHRMPPLLFGTLQQSVYMELLRRQQPEAFEPFLDWLALASRVDFEALFRGGAIVAHLADAVMLDHMRDDLAEAPVDPTLSVPGVAGSLIAVRETPLGRFIVGGPGANTYVGDVAAVIVDVGGNDAYLGDEIAANGWLAPAADGDGAEDDAPLPPGIRVILDLAGNDTYSAPLTDPYRPRLGGTFGGYALLADRAGDDTYLGGTLSAGTACFGVGMLVDFAGDDRYVGQSFSFGVGCFGIGLLYDGGGSNTITGTTHSGGLGLPGGAGLLFLGGDNGDRVSISGRNADPPIGSVYGTPHTWHGMCLGAGLGLRGVPGQDSPDLAGGGVGIVLSGGGNDVFEAGEFGMAVGYFFGLGIFHNLAGDDTYRAGRYGIATGAHQALSVFLDDDGDDDYHVTSVAAIAGNWDMMVSSFVDAAGNDTYRIDSGLGLGSATITSFALFFDGGGRDRYLSMGRNTLGHGGHETDGRRGTRSLGVFIDVGGERDEYLRNGRADPRRADGLRNVTDHVLDDTLTGRGIFFDDGPAPPPELDDRNE